MRGLDRGWLFVCSPRHGRGTWRIWGELRGEKSGGLRELSCNCSVWKYGGSIFQAEEASNRHSDRWE